MVLVLCLLSCVPISIAAQEKVRWHRVYTGEDSVIEVNESSLRFEGDHILRVTFRTVLDKPERLAEKSGVNYKSRIETFSFNASVRTYRVEQVDWLDANGNYVHSYKVVLPGGWKALRAGGMMEKLFQAMNALAPFGTWQVISYRFAEGPTTESNDVPVTRLVGTRVRLNAAQAEVGSKICLLPDYQSRKLTSQDFSRELGVEFRNIGIQADSVESINIKCDGGWQPPKSLLIQLQNQEMLMLWDGVFLVLGKRK